MVRVRTFVEVTEDMGEIICTDIDTVEKAYEIEETMAPNVFITSDGSLLIIEEV